MSSKSNIKPKNVTMASSRHLEEWLYVYISQASYQIHDLNRNKQKLITFPLKYFFIASSGQSVLSNHPLTVCS